MRLAVFPIAAVMGAAGSAWAGQLETAWIPEDPSFVVHIDVEQLRETRLGQILLEDEFELGITQARGEVMSEIGVDPATELNGVTVYAIGPDIEAATVLLHTTDKIDALIEALGEREDELDGYGAFTKRGRTIHSWDKDGEEPVYAHVMPLDEDRLVVVSQKLERVMSAVDVIEGEERNFADARSPGLALKPDRDALLYAEFGALAEIPGLDPASEILQHSQAIQAQLREVGEHLRFDFLVDAGSEERAGDISDVLTGTIALGRLIASDDPDLAFLKDLTRGLTVKAKGTRIAASLKCKIEALLAIIGAMDEDEEECESAVEGELEAEEETD